MSQSDFFTVTDGGSLTFLKGGYLPRLKPRGYTRDKWGFDLQPAGRVQMKNKGLFNRTEMEIRKYLGLQEAVPDEVRRAQPENEGEPMTHKLENYFPKKTKGAQRFVVHVSCYDSGVAFFMPPLFIGKRFSAIYDDGVFLVSTDHEGLLVSANGTDLASQRGCVVFAMAKHFPGIVFPRFHSFWQEVDFDGASFEVNIRELLPKPAPPIRVPQPVQELNGYHEAEYTPPMNGVKSLPPAFPAVDKPKESARDRAVRYVKWLNNFANKNGYQFKTSNGLLILERSDVIRGE